MPKRKTAKPYVVSDPAQLKALAAAGREEVLDTVALIGPCSASEIARSLGRTSHALYYHLKALRACGLLIEKRQPNAGGRETAYFDVPGRPVSVSFNLSTPDRRRAVRTLSRARIKTALSSLERICTSGSATVTGPHRDLWATHLKGWLSQDELAEVNTLFHQLIETLSRNPASHSKQRRAFDFTFTLSPSLPQR